LSDLSIDFTGQKVVVTGASRGISYAIAKAFAQSGAETVIVLSGPDIQDAAKTLSDEAGNLVSGVQCDIFDVKNFRAIFEEIGALDELIANAGLERITPLTDVSQKTESTFRRIIDINIIGTNLTIREAVRNMVKGGRIVITTSVSGKSAISNFSAYITSKHAKIGFMRSIARKLGLKYIRVNCVCPGWVQNRAAMLSLEKIASEEGRPKQGLLDKNTATQCIEGLQKPDDVAQPYLFLASPMAENITGQSLNADRGKFLG
jgi:3-hydroxybutyrate dehydrogenase